MSKKESRLQFTEKERADPYLGESVRKVEKAAEKADKAQQKIPKKKVIKSELIADNSNGKIKVKLHFEDAEKKPPGFSFSSSAKFRSPFRVFVFVITPVGSDVCEGAFLHFFSFLPDSGHKKSSSPGTAEIVVVLHCAVIIQSRYGVEQRCQ